MGYTLPETAAIPTGFTWGHMCGSWWWMSYYFLINQVLMAHGSWLMAQGSWLHAHGSSMARSPQARVPSRPFL